MNTAETQVKAKKALKPFNLEADKQGIHYL